LATPQKPAAKSLLQQDYRFLRHLEALGARFIPRLVVYHDSDTDLHRNVLVTSPLGPSLNELLLFCGNQLTLRTLSLLTLRLLDALEEIHERDVVHGSISPTNIVVGPLGQEDDRLYLINFAQARFFRDPRTHRLNTTSTSSVSAERAKKQNEFLSFCSTFVQRKCTAAPRDDIIALGYVLCYLFHGGLPWTRERTLNLTDLLRQKNTYNDTLQRTPPIQLHYFLKSGYALRQGEIPDYRYLKSLVLRMMEEKHWMDDGQFDWSAQLKVK
jgi:serine/threonine protein kinase